MNAATLPTTVEGTHQLIQELQWRVQQLEKELFGPSSERQTQAPLSKEQILLTLFPPPAQPAATQQVLVRLDEKPAEPRVRRQPAARGLETGTGLTQSQQKTPPPHTKIKTQNTSQKT